MVILLKARKVPLPGWEAWGKTSVRIVIKSIVEAMDVVVSPYRNRQIKRPPGEIGMGIRNGPGALNLGPPESIKKTPGLIGLCKRPLTDAKQDMKTVRSDTSGQRRASLA